MSAIIKEVQVQASVTLHFTFEMRMGVGQSLLKELQKAAWEEAVAVLRKNHPHLAFEPRFVEVKDVIVY